MDKATQSLKNNFSAWREASPKHNSLVDAILGFRCHVIATMRSKTAWEVQKDERTGKTKPVKIGLAPVQRDGLEYEFTVVLELSVDGHVATASKDRTGLFDGQFVVPGVESGAQLKRWLSGNDGGNPEVDVDEFPPLMNTGQKDAPLQFPDQKSSGAETTGDLNQLFQVLREIGLSDKVREYEAYLRHKYDCGLRSLTGEQLAEQLANLRQCREKQELRLKFENYLSRIRQAA